MNEPVSTREFEVVETVVRCGSKKEAALHLNRSIYTVETTIKNVYDKLGINKISDLTLWFCGVKFNIADQITDFKRLVGVICFSLLLSTHSIIGTQIRIRRICFIDKNIETIELNQRRVRRGRMKSRNSNLVLPIHSRSVG